MKFRAALLVLVLGSSGVGGGVGVGHTQQKAPAPPPKPGSSARITPQRVSLSPRFSPGQIFRYEMEFETTTATSRSGLVTDREGPSSLVFTWDATIRLEVLPATGAGGGIRLRTTYEKSIVNIRGDTFDPMANTTRDQYQKLEGKVVEFTLDAAGKVTSVSGLAEIDRASGVEAAQKWIAQLDASSGAPAGGVLPGQKWSSDQPASSLPIAGMAWHTESQYVRDELCHPPNPGAAPDSPGSTPVDSARVNSVPPETLRSGETCAVILAQLSLVRPKAVRNQTPDEYGKNGIQTSGKWDGSAQSLSYISLRTGLVVSVTQTGREEMDVTLATANKSSMRYQGTVLSRSQVALAASDQPAN